MIQTKMRLYVLITSTGLVGDVKQVLKEKVGNVNWRKRDGVCKTYTEMICNV